MSSSFSGLVLGVAIATFALAGCAGSQSGSPGTLPQNRSNAARGERGGSWISSNATTQDLLYVSNDYSNDVDVYALPSGSLVGTLTGFKSPKSLCVDKSGDVFIPDSRAADIVEYAHGGSQPIKTLEDTESPSGCSVDPTTGNLAVSNASDFVSVYKNASGAPVNYATPWPALFAAYDDSGDVFVSGYDDEGIQVAQLRRKWKAVGIVWLDKSPGRQFNVAGMQWYGKDLVIAHTGPYQYGCCGRVHRYTIKGTSGTHAGSYLTATDLADFFIYGSTIVTTNGDSEIVFYNYPIGHPKEIQRIDDGGAYGVVVSEAGSRK
jgi:hypothetical protein